MADPNWLDRRRIDAIHDIQLAEHGGAPGLRDAGLLESALARPQNLAVYGEPDIPALAATYAIAIARNHPYIDGNKRTAYVAMELFLSKNGFDFEASDAEATITTLTMAAGDLPDADFIAWVRRHATPRP